MTWIDVLAVVVAVLVVEALAGIAMGLYMQHYGANRQTTEPPTRSTLTVWEGDEPHGQLYDQDDEQPPPPERKPMIGLE